MTYTVNKLAKLSGVSIRTLHFYDEIGLLKPAFYGENRYRYYKEEQLLMLQQILFYREIGFPLDEIQVIINSSDFDKVEALNSHKKVLEKNLNQTKQLLKTIDKTISHLIGENTMRDAEIFEGFDLNKQNEYEQYLVKNGKATQAQIDKSWDNLKHLKIEDREKFKNGMDMQRFVSLIDENKDPSSKEAQLLVAKFYDSIKIFWTPDKESFIGLSQLYHEHPDFLKFYEAFHPQLLAFLTQAMKIFAERELS